MSATRSSRALRDRVHAELTELLAADGKLGVVPANISEFFDEARQRQIALDYRAQSPDAPAEGRAVIITAGPPGAGKSTALRGVLDGHRRIDPDEIKDLLLAEAEAADLLVTRRDHTLSDSRPVSPRELAGWVHHLSTDIADEVRRTSLELGENIVVEGTLWWPPLAERYSRELAEQDYTSLLVLDVEVPLETSLAQARERWWQGRVSPDHLGGRFISDGAVESFYNQGPVSGCATTARALYREALEAGVLAELLILNRGPGGRAQGARISRTGITSAPGSAKLAVACLRCGRPLTSPESIIRGFGEACVDSD